MNRNVLFQDPTTSPTAFSGHSGIRTDHIYSACVVAHGGQGVASVFIGAQGQPIPKISNVSGTLPGHQATFTDSTTNMIQSGQTGGTIGDALIHAFGATIEQGVYSNAGVLGSYGAGPNEFAEILSKVALEIQIVNIEQIKGPLFLFPGLGGVVGAIASSGGTTAANQLVTFLTNGVPGQGRQLVAPLPLARTDTMRGIVSVPAAGDALNFSVTGSTSVGQATLLWVSALATLTTDLRA